LVATVESPNGNIVFATTHLDHEVEEVRVEQARAINQILIKEGKKTPVVLAGDFNAVPESGTMAEMFKLWIDTAGDSAAPTIPAGNPRRRIDYILVARGGNGAWKTLRSEVLNEPIASDHRPVNVELELVRK
jgi:endonuclease/exonuclease/phosphatase family metal-dependent hydrolase